MRLTAGQDLILAEENETFIRILIVDFFNAARIFAAGVVGKDEQVVPKEQYSSGTKQRL